MLVHTEQKKVVKVLPARLRRILSLCKACVLLLVGELACHKNVIVIVVNGDKMRTKGEQRRRK